MKLFADDVKLYSSFIQRSSRDLQVVTERLAALAEKWQLKISYDDMINVAYIG